MGLFTSKIGIDLGTKNSLVFVPKKGIVLNEPTVVAVSLTDNTILAVGEAAKEMTGRTPDTIKVYRPMKDGVIADYRVTLAMLRYFLRKVVPRYQFFKPEVLVSIPAGITSTERRAVIEATTKAGARAAYVAKEPILAAIGAEIPIQGLDDPVYFVNAWLDINLGMEFTNKIQKTNLTEGTGLWNISTFKELINRSHYRASADAPSFLMRKKVSSPNGKQAA
mgnify:CR=1 FL=1